MQSNALSLRVGLGESKWLAWALTQLVNLFSGMIDGFAAIVVKFEPQTQCLISNRN